MPFRSQSPGDAFDTTGIFRIQFTAGFERAPVGRDAFFALRFSLGGGVRGYP